jgi:hypothetical protein
MNQALYAHMNNKRKIKKKNKETKQNKTKRGWQSDSNGRVPAYKVETLSSTHTKINK